MSSVQVQAVSKIYGSTGGDIVALENIDFTAGEREFISILGPSGCGKSTLLKCVAGLEGCSAGTITVDGELIDHPPEYLGMVFQKDILLDWRSVLSNVMIVADLKGLDRKVLRTKALALLKMVGLEGYEHHNPWELSGGMRQRASLCRALLDDPRLLLMDEPFGALDAMTRDEMTLELQRIWMTSPTTVLFVTHSIVEAVLLSDRVLVMSSQPGRLVEDITVDLPRPRSLEMRRTAEFNDIVERITELFAQLGVFKKAA
jgi:NitT/TauT family transport system ATP-binding protein